MDRQEWLKKRKIGSSDAPVIMGVSPWTTPYQLSYQRINCLERADNFRMKRGRDLEPKALETYEKMTGKMLLGGNTNFLQHPSIDFMTATLDGIALDHTWAVEIKCAGKEDHGKALAKKLPEKYIPQLQHQLEVAELEQMDYFSFDGEEGVIVPVYRDDAYIKDMIAREKEFWERLLSGEYAPLCARDKEYFPVSEAEIAALFDRCASRKKVIDALKKEDDEDREELKEFAAGRHLQFENGTFYYKEEKGRVDYDKIPELEGVDKDLYRKPSIVKWVLNPKREIDIPESIA